ncbi:ABC transporter permease [Streptomyces sp. B6B3]|uniref:ABC transporter permease n=1 Tax=Streptomyces sp. B6B3 TaxID=3153570 RepID=UPI00325F4305
MTTATATPVAVSRDTARGRGNALAGTGTLVRFALRRDRIRLPVWLAALVFTTVSSVSSFESTYADPQDRRDIARTMDSPAGLAMTGPEHYLDGGYDFGAMTGHQMLGFMGIFIGLMSVLTLVRHTRNEEETGRAELLRAGVVGRHSHLASALVVVCGANLLLGLLLWGSLGSMGLAGMDSTGSLLYGAANAAIGITFAGIAAVTVQITTFSRGASGMALGAIGIAYALRATGDVGADFLSWLSPIGWIQRTYVYLDDRWWPLLLNLALALLTAAAGFALSTRRDVGSGLRPPRPGRPTATDALARPVGFAVRLHRGVLFGFAAGLLLFGLMYGSILGDAEEMIEDIDSLQKSIAELGGSSVAESFGSVVMSILAIIAASYVVMATLRPRAEETGGRAEPVLATGVSRDRWLGSHVVVALVGGTLVMLLGGLAFGVSGAASAGESDLLWKLTGASLAYAPALWLTAGIAVLLFGWWPRAAAAAWAVPAYSFLTVYLGEIIEMPDWLANLSPIGHVPQLPAADLDLVPLAVLTVLAAGSIWCGLLGFRRRDLESK